MNQEIEGRENEKKKFEVLREAKKLQEENEELKTRLDK